MVKGLWFEKPPFGSIMEVKAKAIHNTCKIAKNQNYIKVIIESDCKVVANAILGFASCLWSIFALIEDIKLFLKDFPNVSIVWINRLGNMTIHESVH